MLNDNLENVNNNNQKNSNDKSDIKQNFRYDIKSNKIAHSIDEKNTNYKCDSMILYQEKMKNFQLKNKKEYSSSELATTSLDFNDKASDSRSFFSSLKIKSKINKQKSSCIMLNKILGLDKKEKKKQVKKVSFKKKFVSYIDIESYKKYYMENNGISANDKSETKCSCLSF